MEKLQRASAHEPRRLSRHPIPDRLSIVEASAGLRFPIALDMPRLCGRLADSDRLLTSGSAVADASTPRLPAAHRRPAAP